MARQLVTRYPSNCHDCGAAIPVGTTVRWFGRGRVSCCGGRSPAPDAPAPLPPAPPDASSARRPHDPIPPYVPSDALRRLSESTGISIGALASGLQPADVDTLAAAAPLQRLLVRLGSGARFIVPAQHAQHVIRCVAESLVDRIRDVSLLADGGGQ